MLEQVAANDATMDGGPTTYLFLNTVSALLWRIDEVQHSCSEMSQGSHSLHLNDIPLLQRVVQDTGSVNHLEQ